MDITFFSGNHSILKGMAKASTLIVLLFLGACASTPDLPPDDEYIASFEEDDKVDKFEGFNRAVFSFNDFLDRLIFKPVAVGYDFITPYPVKIGVGNFFSNLGEVPNIVNDGLQWKWKQAGNDTGRLLVNSTVGVLGLFDVASKMGLEESDGESFSQTLAVWGVPRGNYLVLPFLGPTTVRGAFSLPVEWATSPVQYLESTQAKIALNGLNLVDDRASLLDEEELISGDRYLFIREVYLQRLDYLEKDGEVEDTFGEDWGDDEYSEDEYSEYDDYEDYGDGE